MYKKIAFILYYNIIAGVWLKYDHGVRLVFFDGENLMSSRRLEKMSGLLHETVAELLVRRSKDPRLSGISITSVKVAPDFKKAIVHYSIMGGDEAKAAAKVALEKAKGFVRSAVGETLGLKYTPVFVFEFDRNLEYAHHISDLFNTIPNFDNTEPTPNDE